MQLNSSKKSISIKPTDEQLHAISLATSGSSHISIDSLAGSAKTTTSILIDNALKKPLLYIAFNKRIVDEAKEKREEAEINKSILAFSDTTEIRTFNSIGHGVWQQGVDAKLVLNGKKNSDLLREVIQDLDTRAIQQEVWDEFFEITSAVALGKCLGYIPDGHARTDKRLIDRHGLSQRLDTQLTELGWEILDLVFLRSIKAAYAGSIDYDDQIYMPALFGGTFPNFPEVIVDEAQDANPCNHAMLRRFKRSRITAVGDDGQSIYAFRGAVPGGMAKLAQDFNMAKAALTVSFRCPENIVKSVHWHRPQMKWVKTGGIVGQILNPTPNLFSGDCAIICRNNAPLFKLAMQLLASGRSVNVHGSDVGPKILAIMRKLGDGSLKQASVLRAIDTWEAEKLAKSSSTAPDIADCMRVFAGHGDSLSTAISWAESLFKQKGTIQLLTGHKSKGLEFDTVYHLDPNLIRGGEQEDNLRYVISTRAKQELYEIHSQDIRWQE